MYACVTADIERFSDAVSKYGCCYTVDDRGAARKLLDTFCEVGIPSTLFILGRYAQEQPGIMDTVRENGYELASHGYSHTDLRTLPVHLLEKELTLSRFLGNAKGFRAPYYGFHQKMVIHLDNYFVYDSSIVPIRTKGVQFRIRMLTESLMEIPISNVGILPFTSMAFRWLPDNVLKGLASFILKRDGYLIMNVHPWECVEVPQEVEVPFYVKKGTGPYFLRRVRAFLERLKKRDVEFVTMEQVYEHHRC